MLESTITAKGQTTLPKSVREHLGLAPGDRLRYIITGDEIRLVRPRKVMTLCGSLSHDGPPVTLEDMDTATRDAAAVRHSRPGQTGP